MAGRGRKKKSDSKPETVLAQITRKDGKILFGEIVCPNTDAAYIHFRNEYHSGLGRKNYQRLNRIGQRQERIHGYGMYLTDEYRRYLSEKYAEYPRVRCYLMGIVDVVYERMVGMKDLPTLEEDETYEFLDWIFSRGSRMLTIVNRKDKAGRTSKRINRRYR